MIKKLIEQIKSDKDLSNLEYKNSLVIGDMHFGIKQNSSIWLSKQVEFIKKQIIPLIEYSEELNIDSVVFLGDLFDVRQSINTMVATDIFKLISELIDIAKTHNCNVYMLGGNHDYYSSFQEKCEFNNYNILFNEYFIQSKDNIQITTKGPSKLWKHNKYMMILPWFETEVKENFVKNLKDAKTDPNCIGIYAHTDLFVIPDTETLKLVNNLNKPIYSGHIHYQTFNEHKKLYNLGAACSFTFNDSDQDRFIYVINEKHNKIVKIKNETTPEFKTINYRKKETDLGSLQPDNYYRFQCKPDDIKTLKKEISKSQLKNVTIQIQFNNMITQSDCSIKTNNFDEFILKNIPPYLIKTFNETVKKYKN
jgi:DNA repair exonuclease SbcCD nuclease subunit